MNSKVQIGINILQNQPFPELSARWKTVEDLGFDSLWLADHFATRFRPDGIWFDGWSLLAAMAAKTSRIRIGTAVSSPTLHNPAMLAKRAMTVDHISGGRLVLGLGSGSIYSAWEREMIGEQPFSTHNRVTLFKEFVTIIDRMLREPRTTYVGKHYQVDDAIMVPLPVQKPRVPLMIAATGNKSLQVAARFADTWNTYGKADVSEQENWQAAKDQCDQLEAHCDQFGRDPGEIRKSFYAFTGGHRYAASRQAFYDFIGKYRELGFTEFIVNWFPEEARAFLGDEAITRRETLEWIATEAIPELNGE